ncbi:hypothetical protein RFM68_26065 [Mesorhizobium sp. MSK_1335]|uniref:Uncharacterized protein n=1 Tax=Mesorhizobium montanum TaxID=3072323 RepID=A0ABU4ZRB7_9HYPH|nr:hypothetical protein [Mesorhizobium sp. MSK_1335]MDX8527957.1 hypothetical protein [Mesorhizobium sp. MSK_1335]
MVRRSRGRPAPTVIDREWPHQVALPDDLCTARNYTLIREFCDKHGLDHWTRKVQAIWPDGRYEEWRLHCFRDPATADAFRNHFVGIVFDPVKDRQGGRTLGAWHRKDEYRRIVDQGPLTVPKALRS